MHFLPVFLLKIARATARPEGGGPAMVIVVRRLYAYLQQELNRAFEGQENVRIVVDRRYDERRSLREPVTRERRQADRRRAKDEIVEVQISG